MVLQKRPDMEIDTPFSGISVFFLVHFFRLACRHFSKFVSDFCSRQFVTNMKGLLNILIMAVLLHLVSCGTPKEMAYISDAERDSAQQILTSYANTIHPGDQLYIYVNSEIIESVIPFNQETHIVALEMSRMNPSNIPASANQRKSYLRTKRAEVAGYLVDENGFITFPVIGKVQAGGISYDSLQNLLQNKLIIGGYVLDPVVTVSPMNFRVSVVGEVRVPQELHVTGERLTIFEALAMCGDVTDSGMRTNVIVMREKHGELTPIQVDLTKKTIFDSEVYYLQQNDIVYVEQNDVKKKMAKYGPTFRQDITSYVRLGSSLSHIAFIVYSRYVIDRSGLFH